MLLAYGFPKTALIKRDIFVYSHVAQRVQFPTGTSYLSFYLQVSCDSMGPTEYVDISIDYTPFMTLNATECSKYSKYKGNWSWVAIPLPKQFTDGKDHTLLFEFYLGGSTPFTVFAIDVIRFVSSSPLNGTVDGVYAAGPCADGGHPVVGNATKDGMCGWQPMTCCKNTGLGEKVRRTIEERGNTTCFTVSTCHKMLNTLTCIDCAPIDHEFYNRTSGKHRICKDYAKAIHAACIETYMKVNERRCVRMGSMFEKPKDLIEYFLGEYSDENEECFAMNYSEILTPDENNYLSDMLKGSDNSLSGGAIAAIVVVCVVIVAFIGVLVFLWLFVYRPRHHEQGNDTDRMYAGQKKKKKQGAGGKKSGDKRDTLKRSGDKRDTLKKSGDKKDTLKKSADKKDTLKKSGGKKGNDVEIELESTAKRSKKGEKKATKKDEYSDSSDSDSDSDEEKETKTKKTMKKDKDTAEGDKKTMKSEKKKEDTLKQSMKSKKKSKGSAAPADTYEEEISY